MRLWCSIFIRSLAWQTNKRRAQRSVCRLAIFDQIVYNKGRKAGERQMIYPVEDLKRQIAAVAQQYHIHAVYLFGSYARGDATETSDVDVLINRENSSIKSLFDLGAFYNDLHEALGKPIDVITTDSLYQPDTQRRVPHFAKALERERMVIYERQ